jgi:hypothetical protein
VLKRIFGFKDSLSVEVQPDIIPVHQVSDLQAAENYRLRAENLWAQGVTSTSAAAQQARVQIGFDAVNAPPRGTALTIIDQIWIQASVTGLIAFNLVPGANLTGTGVVVRFRDARSIPQVNFGVSPFGITEMLADAPALGTAGTTLGVFNAQSAVQYGPIPLGVVLLPFSRLDISLNFASSTLSVFALGRERQLDPSENV